MSPPIMFVGPIVFGPIPAPPTTPPSVGSGGSVQGTAADQTAGAGMGKDFWGLAQFAIPESLLTGHPFSATVDWGDGTAATTGILGFGPDAESISGTHTYIQPGTYTFTVTDVIDGSPTATASGTVTVAPFTSVGDGVIGTGIAVTAQPGTAAVNVPVASFYGPGTTLEGGTQTSTIDWGDGTTSAGVLPGQSGEYGIYERIPVFGSHTYAASGQYPITVTLSVGGNDVGTATGTATVSAGATGGSISATGSSQTAIAGVPTSFLPLASLAAPAVVLGGNNDITAVIDWGDGTPATSAPMMWNALDQGDQATAPVSGRHDYATPGMYTYTVTFTLDGIAQATATGTVAVSAATGPIVTGTATDQTTIAGLPTDFSLAQFTIPEAVFDGSGFTASIDWGDGTAAGVGAPDLGGTTERFSGLHAYAQPGSYTFTVTYISDGVALGSASGTVTVAAGDPGGLLQGQGIDQTATAGVPTSFLPLATFSAPSAAMTNFSSSSTVDWGDGTTTNGMPTLDLTTAGGRTTDRVAGRHAYSAPGTYTYTVTYILDDSITATATGTITVGASTGPVVQGQGTDQTTTAGTSTHFFPLASFTMPISTFEDSMSQIRVDWGDGTPVAPGILDYVWSNQGDQVTVTVGAEHTFGDAGAYTFTVTDVIDGATLATATGSVTVAAGDPGQDSGDTGQGGGTTNQGVSGPVTTVAPPPMPIDLSFDPTPATPPAVQAAAPASTTAAAPTTAAKPAITTPEASTTEASSPDLSVVLGELWAGLYTPPGSDQSGTPVPQGPLAASRSSTLFVVRDLLRPGQSALLAVN